MSYDLIVYAGLAATAIASASTVTALVLRGKDSGDAIGIGFLVMVWPITGFAALITVPVWVPVVIVRHLQRQDAKRRGVLG